MPIQGLPQDGLLKNNATKENFMNYLRNNGDFKANIKLLKKIRDANGDEQQMDQETKDFRNALIAAGFHTI